MSALRLAVVLWCEASSLAVVLTGDIPVWLSVLVLTVIPVVGLAKEDSAWLGPVRAASSIMAILYLLFFPVDWLVLSDRLIFAVVHLLFYLKVHTLLHLRTRRDRNRLYVLCLFEMLAAASMTITLAFLVPLVLFVFVGSLVLLLEQATKDTPVIDEKMLLRPALRTASALSVAVLIFAGAVFVLLPRSTHGGFRIGGVRGIISTGLSEQIRLGDFGEIKRSREVVMRVVVDESRPITAPRWRGAAFDRYADGQWSKTLGGMSELPRSPDGQFLLERPTGEEGIASEVFLEPLDTDLIFLPPASQRLIDAAGLRFCGSIPGCANRKISKGRPALHRRVAARCTSGLILSRSGVAWLRSKGVLPPRCRRSPTISISSFARSFRKADRYRRRLPQWRVMSKASTGTPSIHHRAGVRIRWKTFYSRFEPGIASFSQLPW